MRKPVKGDKIPVLHSSHAVLQWAEFSRETDRYWIDTGGERWRKRDGHRAGSDGYTWRYVPLHWPAFVGDEGLAAKRRRLREANEFLRLAMEAHLRADKQQDVARYELRCYVETAPVTETTP